ncbi:SGNH/GDSL hydrolase family protein [Lapidilactobacillus bayanensis]|uniref:SGNH/GDSL hydrolase family protein n=1 Tax=Lapidilactobacillus bayanensis TaxID=2485998 RepID=UPI000F7B2C93|nr:SGNH/GDSL hydrolase family protein [Lapidilactobacillus bayanensis]
MLLSKNSKLLFTGDSVTDCGRDRHGYPGTTESLGAGYPNLISAALTAIYPELTVMVQNTGVSGDTTNQLVDRWDKDVIDYHPNFTSILIGVNDVWRHFDAPFYHPTDLVFSEQYRENYQLLIEKSKADSEKILIISPFMFEANHEEPMRKMVDQYRMIAKDLAEKNDLIYVDVQSRVDDYLKNQSSYILSVDRVHPNIKGHMLVASIILNALEFDWQHQLND